MEGEEAVLPWVELLKLYLAIQAHFELADFELFVEPLLAASLLFLLIFPATVSLN